LPSALSYGKRSRGAAAVCLYLPCTTTQARFCAFWQARSFGTCPAEAATCPGFDRCIAEQGGCTRETAGGILTICNWPGDVSAAREPMVSWRHSLRHDQRTLVAQYELTGSRQPRGSTFFNDETSGKRPIVLLVSV
jgi:hypothetical protein